MHFATVDDDYWGRWPAHLHGMGELVDAMGLGATVFVLGDPNDESSPAAAILKMPPNFVLSRHAHRSERVEIIIEGTLDVGGRVLGPGDVMTATFEEAYGDHVAGDKGCTTVEIFSSLAGVHDTLWATPDGMQSVDLAAPEAREFLAGGAASATDAVR
jgi:hypothetical protein